MTDDQINIAIAQVCGWTQCASVWFRHEDDPCGYDEVPNYCHDLNAMHEAVFVLSVGSASQPGQYETYCQWLDRITGDDGYSATARQRSEAFLKTLGLWRE